jgi:hypothetical protein
MNNNDSGKFRSSLALADPPAGLSNYAQALWYAGKGEWDQAHQIVQDIEDSTAAHIHAYLHRQEGDLSNARYWYARAGTRFPQLTLEEEWDALVVQYVK